LNGYQKAIDLDPSLPGADEVDNIQRFVGKMCKLVSSKNGVKPKKLTQMVQSLPADRKTQGRDRVEFKELKVGANTGKCVHAKVVAPVSRDADIPISFLLCDKDTDMLVLSVYNVTGDLINGIKVGDLCVVLDPLLKQIRLTNDEKDQSYPCLHVTSPANFVVNGRSLHRNAYSLPSVKLEAR